MIKDLERKLKINGKPVQVICNQIAYESLSKLVVLPELLKQLESKENHEHAQS
jgi:hypothetical protein